MSVLYRGEAIEKTPERARSRACSFWHCICKNDEIWKMETFRKNKKIFERVGS